MSVDGMQLQERGRMNRGDLRYVVAMLGICLLLGCSTNAMNDAPDGASTTDPSARIVGCWNQLMLDEVGRWWDGGLYRVQWKDGRLQMEIDTYESATAGIIQSTALTDVTFDGAVWRFRSDWENGQFGLFVLDRIDDDVFEGYVYVDGQKWSKNRWQRVAAPGARSAIDSAPAKRIARAP